MATAINMPSHSCWSVITSQLSLHHPVREARRQATNTQQTGCTCHNTYRWFLCGTTAIACACRKLHWTCFGSATLTKQQRCWHMHTVIAAACAALSAVALSWLFMLVCHGMAAAACHCRTPPETKTSTFDLRVDYILPSRCDCVCISFWRLYNHTASLGLVGSNT